MRRGSERMKRVKSEETSREEIKREGRVMRE